MGSLKMDPMEIRAPDSYQTETLIDPLEDPFHDSFHDSLQDISCNELELALMTSLEESWKLQSTYDSRWESFQSILSRLKRLGILDKSMQNVYDLLSSVLYKYSYNQEVSITEEEFIQIDRCLRFFRMKPEERSHFNDTIHRIRFAKV